MHIRQVVTVASDFDSAVSALEKLTHSKVSHRDPPDYANLGIRNAVIPAGSDFLEVVSPIRPSCTAARYLAKTGSEGGYMVILQTEDFSETTERVRTAGGRFIYTEEYPDQRQWHIHPVDIGGAIVAIDSGSYSDAWRWAGPDWATKSDRRHLHNIKGVQLTCHEPNVRAARWNQMLGGTLTDGSGGPDLTLGDSVVRFRQWSEPYDRVTHVFLGKGTAYGTDKQLENSSYIVSCAGVSYVID